MGLSRNKVAVPEGAAGSPPFYGEFRARFVSGVCPMRVERFHGPVWGCWCGRDRWLGWACPVREWYGCAFGFPDRHPTVVSIVVRFDAHAEWPASVGRVAERVARGGLRTG